MCVRACVRVCHLSPYLDGLVGARVEVLARYDQSSDPVVLSGQLLYQLLCLYVPDLERDGGRQREKAIIWRRDGAREGGKEREQGIYKEVT